MGAYKQFLTSDIIVAPLEVSKGFTFYVTESLAPSDEIAPLIVPYFIENPNPQAYTYPGVGIDRLIGQNRTASFNPNTDPTTGLYYPPSLYFNPYQLNYTKLVFNSIKELYYSNYLSSSYSDPVSRPQLVPGRDEEGNRYVGSASSQAYDNYLQSSLVFPRFFPSQYTSSYIGVLSIPAGIYGDYIQPGSFRMSFPSGTFYDDGQGNLFTGSNLVGNVIYTHGIITLTGNETIYGPASVASALYGTAIYGTSVYGSVITPAYWETVVLNFYSSSNFTCSFSSSYTIYETQYKCTIRENEYNFSLNPSIISGSYNTSSNAGTLYGFATESYFSPYITTVGLYDEQQNLLAVGKLSQPLPTSPTTDTTILINLDR